MPILGILASSRPAAAADTGAMFPLQVITVGPAGASSVTFTNIPNTYSHLQVRYISRNAAVTDTTYLRVNSDTGNNYSWHHLRGNGSAATATASSTTGSIEMPFTAYSGTTASVYGASVVDILDYANTNKYKTVRALGGADLNGSGALFFTSGLWQSTSAITSLSIFPSTGNFESNSTFALYAVKAAS